MTAVASATACLVCGAPCGDPIYQRDSTASVSSQARVLTVPTIVHACARCGHLQTKPLDDIAGYYDATYNNHLESDEADDLYDVQNGVPVYRNGHQAVVALAKLNLPHGASVLDFGCAKGTTLRAMVTARPDLDAAVFDVSDVYRPWWDRFIKAENQATYTPPDAWRERFDVVLSFFALEHVAEPRAFLASAWQLLKPGGTLHLIVPNIRRNIGDMIVVDHVNHFMPSSLHYAFTEAGFVDVRIDEDAHAAAYVIDATRAATSPGRPELDPNVATYLAEGRSYASFWSGAGDAVAAFERDVARGRRSAIYGSGLYGAFVASQLRDRTNLAYFLDQNPHQQAKVIFEKAVRPPDAIGADIEVIYAALNPARARDIIAGVPALHSRPREVFYL
jgi:2-polyprenyl-3-methyl-5-hydroxy-6-metoxy-1,4-benzoquinol methylase